MEDYEKLARELIETHIEDTISYDDTKTRAEILEELRDDTQDVFGNMTGSRTCNTWEAQQFLQTSGAMFDEEILQLFDDIDDNYFGEILKRGAETLDVVILELLAPQIIDEMMEEA